MGTRLSVKGWRKVIAQCRGCMIPLIGPVLFYGRLFWLAADFLCIQLGIHATVP